MATFGTKFLKSKIVCQFALSALVLSLVAGCQAFRSGTDWRVSARNADRYTLGVRGNIASKDGAFVRLSTDELGTTSFGNAEFSSSAEAWRSQWIDVQADLEVSPGAWGTIWVRVERPGAQPWVEQAPPISGGKGTKVRQTVRVAVPSSAATTTFGVFLKGGGYVYADNFRISRRQPSSTPALKLQEVLGKAVSLIQDNSYHGQSEVWRSIRGDIEGLSTGIQTKEDVNLILRYVFSNLGDKHSFVISSSSGGAPSAGGAANSSIPAARVLDDGIAYIDVPSLSGLESGAAERYSSSALRSITRLPSNQCGWIVDLRRNTGGNMWPMLAGLKPLLGSGPVGYFVSRDGQRRAWIAGAGLEHNSDVVSSNLEEVPVAVLYGNQTASSGEAVAVAFLGRNVTRSFGQPTAGLTTATRAFFLEDGTRLQLAIAAYADRNGTVMHGKLMPDTTTAASEETLIAARDWLRERCAKTVSP